MTEYEIRITGVHYGANGDSVAGQKDTEEMHVRTRELLSRIDRVSPIVTLSPDPNNHVHENALQARALGNRIGRVALECVDLVWDLLRASGQPMLLAKVKEVTIRNHGYAVVTVSAEALQQTQTTVASETEWGPWLSDLPLLPPSEQLQAEEEASFVLENVFFPNLNECKGKTYVHGQMSKDDKNVQGEMSKENVQELSDEELSLKPFDASELRPPYKRGSERWHYYGV